MTSLNLRSLGKAAIELLYPSRCLLCGQAGSVLCDSCVSALPHAGGARCQVCWLPLSAGAPCERCVRFPIALTGLRSAFRHEGQTRRIVQDLKFRGLTSLAEPMGDAMAETVATSGFEFDAVAAVPMSGMWRRTRGYNQSELLARDVARGLGLPLTLPLLRNGRRPAQTETHSREQRQLNMRDAFRVPRPDDVRGQRLLVVDDVATTCATLDSCARALLAAGATSVYGLTFARED